MRVHSCATQATKHPTKTLLPLLLQKILVDTLLILPHCERGKKRWMGKSATTTCKQLDEQTSNLNFSSCEGMWGDEQSLLALQKAVVMSAHGHVFQLLFHSLLWERIALFLFIHFSVTNSNSSGTQGEKQAPFSLPLPPPRHCSVITWSQEGIYVLQSWLQTHNSNVHSRLLPTAPLGILIALEGSWNLPASVSPPYLICSRRQLHMMARLPVVKAPLFASTVSYLK